MSVGEGLVEGDRVGIDSGDGSSLVLVPSRKGRSDDNGVPHGPP